MAFPRATTTALSAPKLLTRTRNPVTKSTTNPSDQRADELTSWAAKALDYPNPSCDIVSGDASFRRYFRIATGDEVYIGMDAPPEHEDCVPFVSLAHHWREHGIPVPAIRAENLAKGFLLLEDFGDEQYLDSLDAQSADQLYGSAMTTLLHLQQIPETDQYKLPPYDRRLLLTEMQLFTDWLVGRKLEIPLSEAEQQIIQPVFEILIANALEQPRVTVHRDYHSRNLMIRQGEPGVLDFQDAVRGPITYDLVSLLRDCYCVWPPEKVTAWVEQYWQRSREAGLHDVALSRFRRWFDLMGIQRHLKAAGIFARLSLRDGKHGYLEDIPRTVGYILQVSADYPELADFREWLLDKIEPALNNLQRPVEQAPA